jgi:hypothetical protein
MTLGLRKHRRPGNRAPTKAEQAQQDAQRDHGCAMCLLLGFDKNACGRNEIHHRTVGDLHGNKRLGQDFTIGLGSWHHRGEILEQYPTVDAMRAQFGPSLAHHKRAFVDLIAEKLGERSTAALQAWQDDQILTGEVA